MIDEKNIPEELKGGLIPNIDPEKLFDEKEYTSIIIGPEGISKKDNDNADSLAALMSKKTTREEKDEALKRLKKNNAQAFLLNAISNTKNTSQKSFIIAACWETGLDFSTNCSFFFDLVCSEDFNVSFEALTVIREMDATIDSHSLQTALDTLKKIASPSISVLDAMAWIDQKLNTK